MPLAIHPCPAAWAGVALANAVDPGFAHPVRRATPWSRTVHGSSVQAFSAALPSLSSRVPGSRRLLTAAMIGDVFCYCPHASARLYYARDSTETAMAQTTKPTDYVYVPVQVELYADLVRRSGKADVSGFIHHSVESFLERSEGDPNIWSAEYVEQLAEEEDATFREEYGDPGRGYQWQTAFLPNGTKIRMFYGGQDSHAESDMEDSGSARSRCPRRNSPVALPTIPTATHGGTSTSSFPATGRGSLRTVCADKRPHSHLFRCPISRGV